MIRFLKIFLLATFAAAWVFAAPVTYRSQGGSFVTVELMANPDRAMVYEPTYGLSTFLLKSVDNGRYWFACEKIGMRLLIVESNPGVITFGSIETGQCESYTVVGSGGSTYTPSAPSIPAAPRQDRCYTCAGLLRCPVCHGSGRAINYTGGPSRPCSACGGSGRCYHCHGTGKQ